MHSIPAIVWTVALDDGRLRSAWYPTSDEVAPAPVRVPAQRTRDDVPATVAA